MKIDFEESFLELAGDGKIRTVKQIREALGLPTTSNVGESLANLQMRLAGSSRGIRLRRTVLRPKTQEQVWWIEIKNPPKAS